MQILLVSSRYLPHRGGLETVVHNLSQELQNQGHEVHIVTNRYPRTLPAHERINGISVIRLHFLLPDWTFLRRSHIDLFLAGLLYRSWTKFLLGKLIHDFQPDVINSHYLSETAEFVGRCLPEKGKSIPWVISLHGGDVDGEPFKDKAHLERFRRIAQQADRLIACSGFLARQAAELEPALAEKIQVIHNGVDVNLFSQAEKNAIRQPYILAVGQLVRHKGFDVLVEAFGEVSEKHQNVNLVIAGDGECRPELEKQIREKGLGDRVLLAGGVEAAKVASLMAGCLFVTMPSRREPFGMSALEGMAAGRCVLAAPVGGIPEFLPCPPNQMVPLDIPGWAQVLDDWMSKATTGNLDGSANRAAAQEHTWQKVTTEYLKVYQQVLA